MNYYSQISDFRDLNPSQEVNEALSSLVESVVSLGGPENIEEHIQMLNQISTEERIHLQKLCAKAESLLEKFWAEKMLIEDASITDFPYFGNYLELVQREMHILNLTDAQKESGFTFIGGGAIPFTPIILAQKYGIRSIVVDIDTTAIELSKRLVQKLNLEDQIEIIEADGAHFNGYTNSGVIFVAALAGVDQQTKAAIFKSIWSQVSSDQILITRSSWGARQLLYPTVNTIAGFRKISEYHPDDYVINSVLVFEKENEYEES